jgi:hypothetical protein
LKNIANIEPEILFLVTSAKMTTQLLMNDINAMLQRFQEQPDGAWDDLPDDAQVEIIKQMDDLCTRTGEVERQCAPCKVELTYNDPSTHSTF